MKQIRIICLLLFALIFFYSCTDVFNEFTITGEVKNYRSKKLYLSHLTVDKIEKTDSVTIEKGQFSFTGKTEVPDFYILQTEDNDYITLIIKPGEEIRIFADASDFSHNYEIEGSVDSRNIKELNLTLQRNIEKIDSINRVYRQYLNSRRLPAIKQQLDSTFESIIESHRHYTIRFIENNMNSIASVMALYQQITPRMYVLDPIDDISYFEKVDSSLYAKYPESEAIQALHKEVIRNRRKINNNLASSGNVAIGSIAPEIALPNPEGDTIPLSALRGNIVLLDFWASWCKPCREENPNLVDNYDEYSDEDFEIYQVSLDRTRQDWVDGIQEDNLDWIHVSDLKYWDSRVVNLYNLSAIPANFLLDRQGRIIAKNLRGEQLSQRLEQIFE